MDIHRITWDLMRCTTHLSQHLNKERHFWKFPCFENIEDKAEWAYNYIDTNNDIETAFTLAKLDRSLWHRMLNDPNLETEDFMMLKSVAKTLFEIHNWYLKEAYHIQDEAIMKCEYYLNTITGEVRNSKTQEVLQAPKKPTGSPEELYTDEAQKAFAKAIEKGWIEKSTTGLKWLGTDGKGKKAELAYLCASIYGYIYSSYNGNLGNNVPYEALNKYFGVTRLDRAVQEVFEAKKPQLWRKRIDEIFQD